MPIMHQSDVGNIPFSAPNEKTDLGISEQADCGQRVTQEKCTGKFG